MKYIAIGLIKLYQKCISPLKPNRCRFTPTCSAYAIEAFTKRGFFAALILTVWRILRCNPFCKPGYDPVPEKGFRRVAVSCAGETEIQGADVRAQMPSASETNSSDEEQTRGIT